MFYFLFLSLCIVHIILIFLYIYFDSLKKNNDNPISKKVNMEPSKKPTSNNNTITKIYNNNNKREINLQGNHVKQQFEINKKRSK